MRKIRIGHSIYFNPDTQSKDILPLLECLSYAIVINRRIDFFLKGILTQKDGPAGGDPGWSLHWIPEADEALFPEDWKKCMAQLPPAEQGCFEAWTDQSISDLEPPCAYYAKEVVRHHVLEVLEDFRAQHPARADEVNAAIKDFGLS